MGMAFRRSPKDKAWDCLIYYAVGLLSLLSLLPFLYVLMVSFITPKDYNMYGITWPKHWTLANYRYVLFGIDTVKNGYMITIIVTALGTTLATMSTTLLGYGLSRKDLPGRKVISSLVIFTMYFGGGMIPAYLVVKFLGLMNTIWCLILPISYSAWNTMLVRTFIRGLPIEMEESARIDGASDPRIAFSIIIPLSKPVIATIALFFAVGFWNDWWHGFLYLTNKKLYPLQLVLKDLISLTSRNMAEADTSAIQAMDKVSTMPTEVMRMTAIVVAVFPIMCVYPFVQKYFIKGALVGALKG